MWRNGRWIVVLVVAMSCAPVPAFACGRSQCLAPGEISWDLRPLSPRCAGPAKTGNQQQCSGTNGALYFVNLESHAKVPYEWTVTATIDPPTAGVSALVGCEPSLLKNPAQCDGVNVHEASKQPLRLVPGQRVPRYPIEATVDPASNPPEGRQLSIKVCLSRPGRATPICFERWFATAGGKINPK